MQEVFEISDIFFGQMKLHILKIWLFSNKCIQRFKQIHIYISISKTNQFQFLQKNISELFCAMSCSSLKSRLTELFVVDKTNNKACNKYYFFKTNAIKGLDKYIPASKQINSNICRNTFPNYFAQWVAVG